MTSINNDTPLVSVIVPIYNVERYLDRCVESIVNQTYKNLEIILVDDGSPDNCPEMCDEWARKDNRIKVVHKPNGGLSDARNAGFEVSNGELICYIDSDDWIELNFIHSLYEAMMNAQADVVECATNYVSEDGHVLRIRKTPDSVHLDKISALRKLVLEDGVYQTVWNKLYKREVCIPFEKGKLNEDEFFTWKVFDNINKLALVEKPMYNYLQRGGSIIQSNYSIRRLDGLRAKFERMQELQKYERLASLTSQQLALDCMWHLQSVLRCLDGEEKTSAVNEILDILRNTPKVKWNRLQLNLKYRVWYTGFRLMPKTISKLRNCLGIGL